MIVSELQQQAYAQRVELQDALLGYIESRRETISTTRRIIYEGKSASKDSDAEYARDASHEELRDYESMNAQHKN